MATEEKHPETANEVNLEESPPEINIDLDDPSTAEFKNAVESHYKKFCESLVKEYLEIKAAYNKDFDAKFDNTNKNHKAEYEERNQQISALSEELQFKQRRLEHLLLAIENFVTLKYRRIHLRKMIDQWREDNIIKRKVKTHEIYADNYAKRKLGHKCFAGWRKETHISRKRMIEQEFAFKVEQVKTGKLAIYDKKIREYLTKIEAAKRILAEEIAIKEKLTLQYEQALGRGVDVLSKETQVISSNPMITGMFNER